jgi:hypothetical protein
MFSRTLRLAAAAALIALAGCGGGNPKTAPVKGTVTYKGRPVPNGTVTFIPESGPTATGELGPDGSYTLTTFRRGDGAVPGRYTVVIVAMQDNAGRLPEERTPLPPPIVPEKYTSAVTSDLRAEVEDRENTLDFPLKDEKRR